MKHVRLPVGIFVAPLHHTTSTTVFSEKKKDGEITKYVVCTMNAEVYHEPNSECLHTSIKQCQNTIGAHSTVGTFSEKQT